MDFRSIHNGTFTVKDNRHMVTLKQGEVANLSERFRYDKRLEAIEKVPNFVESVAKEVAPAATQDPESIVAKVVKKLKRKSK